MKSTLLETGKWWIKVAFIGLFSVLLLVISAGNLKNAYLLKNPMEFLMTFFSQSLLMMIGAVGIIHVTFKIYGYWKEGKPPNHVRPD